MWSGMPFLRFGECLDALGAERLADKSAALENTYPLQVRLELVAGRTERVAAAVAEHRAFAAIFTLSHDCL